MDRYKVLVVGCGNIAGRFDMTVKPTNYPCTHAGAYHLDDRFVIKACIDPNQEVRREFMEYWRVPAGYSSFREVEDFIGDYDVISICSPTSQHKSDVRNAIKLNPKLIFCEKPITPNAADSHQLIDQCKESNILLGVNHTRRWDPHIIQLKSDIKESRRGALHSVVATYNKGILNNGSHLIDLLHYLFGSLNIIATTNKVFDYSDNDPSISTLLTTGKGIPIHCAVGHAKDFSIFEIQFIFSSGVLVMKDGGLSWGTRSLTESKDFLGYKVLGKDEYLDGGYKLAMKNAIDNIYQALADDSKLLSDGCSAYRAQKMCEEIKGFE